MKKLLLSVAIVISSSSLFAQFPAPYCAEVFNTGVEPITLVNFAGINNVTPPTLTGAVANNNFLSLTGNVVVGGTYTITLKGNTDGNFNNNYVVFVDWNNDNDFLDAGEIYNIGSIIGSSGVDAKQLTGRIAVPTSVSIGNKRMRVSKKFNNSTTIFQTACNVAGANNYGQAQDYTLAVTLPSCLAPSSGIAVVDPFLNANLSWTAGGNTNNEYVFQLAGVGVPADAINTGVNVVGTSVSVPALTPETFYEFYVRTECTDGLEYSTWSGPFKFNTVTPTVPNCSTYISPLDVAVNVPRVTQGTFINSVTLRWNAATGDGVTPLTGYKLFIGTSLPITETVTPTPWTDTGVVFNNRLANTTYYWKIVPYNSVGSAVNCPTFSFTTAADPLALDTFTSANFKSFPNPVKDVLNLSYDKNITSISVLNLLGQVVLSNSLDNKEAKIDMSGLTTGTYMVKVTSDNEVKTIKVIKE